jgi:hypothetical protein
LSLVTIARSAFAVAARTHERALRPVAVAAGSEHHDQPALVSDRAARSTFSTLSGVWA